MAFKYLHYSFEEKATVTKYLIPTRIVSFSGVQNPELLLADSPRQVSIHNKHTCTVQTGGYILLDFGSEIQGGVELSVASVLQKEIPQKRLRIVFGESVSEALSAIGDGHNALNDHSTRDMVVETTSMSTMRYGNTGFRFVKIQALDCGVQFTGIKGILEYRDIPYLGSFQCSDPRLNRIFDTGAYTVHLCMQDYIWDGIKRDRLVWIGDMHPEVSTIARVFGRDPSVQKSLDFTRDAFPMGGEDSWMIFPSYSFWWMIIHRDWYLHWGDYPYLLQQKEYVYALCRQILKHISPDGTVDFGGKFFIDWSSNKTDSMEAGFRGCLILGLQAAADLLRFYGDAEFARQMEDAIPLVRLRVPPYHRNKQVCAMAALGGLCPRETAAGILKTDLLGGLSTFYGCYVLQLLGETRDTEAALAILRGYWGAMLDLGATTFWEDFDIAWTQNAGRIDEIVPPDKHDVHAEYGKFCYQKLRHSLCHGWASGPCTYLSRFVLGIEIADAGCKTLKITPQLGDLQWAKGTFPTPCGVVTVEHRKVGDSVQTTVDAPVEIKILCDTL